MTARASDFPPLSPRVRQFLDAPRFATVASIDPDGAPHQAVAWYLLQGDEIVVNSAQGRHWPANLKRDPRMSFTVADAYDYVMLSGIAEIDEDQERAHADIAAMCRLYHADDPESAERQIERVFKPQDRISFRLRPARIYEHFD